MPDIGRRERVDQTFDRLFFQNGKDELTITLMAAASVSGPIEVTVQCLSTSDNGLWLDS